MLSLEEETELLEQSVYDKEAFQQLVLRHLPLVASITWSLNTKSQDFDDLFSEGIIGLMKAIKTFNLSRGVRLSSYAKKWIFFAIKKAMTQQSAIKNCFQENIISVDDLTEEIPSKVATQEEVIMQDEIYFKQKSMLKTALTYLSTKEKYVISHRCIYEKTKSLKIIANELGHSQERIRQIEKSSLEKIRKRIYWDNFLCQHSC